MKKILSFLFILIFSVSVFCFDVSAHEDTEVLFTSDFGILVYNNIEYIAIDSKDIYSSYSDYVTVNDVHLDESQRKDVKKLDLIIYDDCTLNATYMLQSVGVISIDYIEQEYYKNYIMTLEGVPNDVFIEFEYPDENIYINDFDLLKGEKTELILTDDEEWFWVCSDIATDKIWMEIGLIIEQNDKYYFIDSSEINDEFYYDDYVGKTFPAYEIKDEQLIISVDKAINGDYESDYELSKKVLSAVLNFFLIFLFGIIPLILLIVFGVLSLKIKTKFRKWFAILAVLCATEIIIFIVFYIIW